ncbi:helicase-exonuclease AddAB subunit AddA [Granulicatella sp. zg-84]|nr:helicase-exonuclease AddAB subunit AddA [Granulicatella sp. zg-84]
MQMIPVKPTNVTFTDSQWEAIYETGSHILVSASAGSGKTTVLTKRIVEKLRRGTKIEELLVVTYTELAAKEMRERIEKELKNVINIETDVDTKRHLQMQLRLLPQANISTIHAFCLKVIRKHFASVDMDPVFRLMTDETEILLLKEKVWHELKEKLYDRQSFRQLAKAYSSDKYDDKLTDLIFSLYDFSRANANPDEWLKRLASLYNMDNLTDSVLFQSLIKPYVISMLEDAVFQLEQGIQCLNGDERLDKVTCLLSDEKVLIEYVLNSLVENKDYDSVYAAIKQIEFLRFPSIKKDSDVKEFSEQAKVYRDKAKKTVENMIEAVFYCQEQVHLDLLHKILPYIDEMIDVVTLFSKAYAQEKKEYNVLEFSDLEHITLSILAPMHNGNRHISPVALEYQELFEEIMVDEYQDVNRLQETILSYLTNGKNMFMVGDVKQSIYSFRLADPSLFLEKYLAFGNEQGGKRIILAENFRSRGEVLHATNFIFQQIMDQQVGDMAYDDDAMLVQGSQAYADGSGYELSVLLYEKETHQEQELDMDVSEMFKIDTKTEGEIVMVAKEIERLIQSTFLVQSTEKENGKFKQRPITYADIVLLVPTKKNNVVIQEIFNRYHIPIQIDEAETYFQRTEIMIMMSLLKIIDNPHQDIPLVSVLRSPLVALDENDLAAIRINQRTSGYYEAVQSFVADFERGSLPQNAFHEAIYKKLVRFMERLNTWRFMATKESLVSLIWHIYQETHFLDYVLGLPSGRQRQANLHALYERAREYEQTAFKGLFQFVQFIEKMQEKDKDLSEASLSTGNENVVKLMTIHASKGLEFPVVFVLDLNKSFNKRDSQSSYVFTEKYGIGTDYFDIEKKFQFPTLARFGMSRYKEKKLLAEEMRKLYVALTRAKEKLYLVGNCVNEKDYWEKLSGIASYNEVVLPSGSRLSSQSALSWINMALVRHRMAENNYLPVYTYPTVLLQSPIRFTIQFFKEQDLMINQSEVSDIKTVTEWVQEQVIDVSHSEDMQDIIQTIEHVYPYMAQVQTTTYQSVSELKRMAEDPDLLEMQPLGQGNRYVSDDLMVPMFMKEDMVTNTMIGTAVHLVMQTISLEQTVTMQMIDTHINQFVSKGLMSQEVAEKINRYNILRFFSTDLGQLMLKQQRLLHREVPFSLAVNAHLLFQSMEKTDEKVLIHGVVDGYIEYDDEIILYDFKTDYIGQNITVETIMNRYRQQMNVYATALTSILHKPVTKKYLCLLSIGENVLVD